MGAAQSSDGGGFVQDDTAVVTATKTAVKKTSQSSIETIVADFRSSIQKGAVSESITKNDFDTAIEVAQHVFAFIRLLVATKQMPKSEAENIVQKITRERLSFEAKQNKAESAVAEIAEAQEAVAVAEGVSEGYRMAPGPVSMNLKY